TETLREPGTRQPALVLARKRIRFLCLSDTLRGADTLKRVSLRVTDAASGALLEEDLRFMQFGSAGLALENPAGGGGARFFPLKTAAGDTGAFLELPAAFVEGSGWSQSLGILDVRREIAGTD